MINYRDYTYISVLAPYIRDLICEKRSLGFIYNDQAYQLKRFDMYWYSHAYDEVCISLKGWKSGYAKRQMKVEAAKVAV